MNGKKWIKVWISIIILIISIVGITNYIIDPYHIFKKENEYYKAPIQTRFLKVEYLEENKNKYNSYMMSSSRIGTTSPKVIEKYIKNSKFYNFWLGSANLDDIRIHLEYMLKQNYKIENLYLQIGLDNMYNSNYTESVHPYVVDNSIILFYLNRLFNIDIASIYKKMIAYSKRSFYQLNIKTGVLNYINRDRWISEDHINYIKNEPSFHKLLQPEYRFITKNKVRQNLSIINKLCSDNHINLIIFTTPHHKVKMDQFDTESYLDFLKVISEFNNFYNFSGYNTVTTNNYNYYENNHYLPNVANLIAAKIFNDNSISVPNDFGFYVTKKNIDRYLKKHKLEIENYRKRLKF